MVEVSFNSVLRHFINTFSKAEQIENENFHMIVYQILAVEQRKLQRLLSQEPLQDAVLICSSNARYNLISSDSFVPDCQDFNIE